MYYSVDIAIHIKKLQWLRKQDTVWGSYLDLDLCRQETDTLYNGPNEGILSIKYYFTLSQNKIKNLFIIIIKAPDEVIGVWNILLSDWLPMIFNAGLCPIITCKLCLLSNQVITMIDLLKLALEST